MSGWIGSALARVRTGRPRPRAVGARATLLLPRGVFLVRRLSPDRVERATRLGPLSHHLSAMAGRPPDAGALLGDALGDGLRYAEGAGALRFCLEELIPELRAFGAAPGARRAGVPRAVSGMPAVSERAFAALEERSAELRAALEAPLAQALPSDELLAEWAGVPCAIVGGALVPLEPIARSDGSAPSVCAEGQLYRLCEGAARPWRLQRRRLRERMRRHAARATADDPHLTARAGAAIDAARSILDPFRPRRCAGGELLFRDRDHRLEHCRGRWLLVRGPVAHRLGEASLRVALPVEGRTRRERLKARPRLCAPRGALWTRRGEPVQGWLCMGTGAQYQRLLTRRFTDGEAVVQWLDAAVIVATDRSGFHRQWRAIRAFEEGPHR